MRSAFREEPCRGALNRVTNSPYLEWSLNPYMGCVHRCTFCYVRNFEKRAQRPFGEEYGTSIRVKVNIVQVLRSELGRRSWKRQRVAIGAATDPYQPAEGSYRLTRGCLEALHAARTPFAIITRSPLIVRDVDILGSAAEAAGAEVNFSIPTLDREVWRKTEPGTAPPHQRLRVLERLAAAGVPVGVGIAPILPGLSDAPEQLEAVVRAAKEAGARRVWAKVLDLRPGQREHFLACLERDWPEQLSYYRRLYDGRSFLTTAQAAPILARVSELQGSSGFEEPGRARVRPEPEHQLQLL